MRSNEWMEKKISDYKRFIVTLLILSSYLYIGTLISIYEYQTNFHYYLYAILSLTLPSAIVMIAKTKRWQRKLMGNK
ncbi:YrhC family protein [Halobacillus salinus]|uniref:YrhC-like protein n=1 Tax=Halobacillus salinus TaxID=192814 RepID=A0A4Z0H4V3_9BACI|nr:YrhC family protein [Halobacillus salinus]TGB04225.1 hypothetical protein E4663_04260 [Halobacillus salinus]